MEAGPREARPEMLALRRRASRSVDAFAVHAGLCRRQRQDQRARIFILLHFLSGNFCDNN